MERERLVVERQRAAAIEVGGARNARPASGSACRARPDERYRTVEPALEWSAIGHELRTPLNAILGNVELLLDGSAGPLSAEARTCLGDVQAAGGQLMHQIGWLMLLAQVNAATPLRPSATVDLAALVRAALPSARSGLDALEPVDEEPIFPVRGDAFWLEVLAKALAEIGRACNGGAVRVSRPKVGSAPNQGRRRLHVDGPGLAPAALPPVPWRLIEAIVARHDGEVAVFEGGLWLSWPEAPR